MLIEIPGALRPLQAAIAIRERREPRAPGVHVSQIVDDIAITMGWFKRAERTEGGGVGIGAEEMFWELGVAWEETYARGLKALYGGEKPAPRTLDGITGSPDWVRASGAIDEIKLTWISSRDGDQHPKIKKFVYQLRAYMHLYQSELGYLTGGYVRGNYRDRIVDIKRWRVSPELATARALQDHWDRLRDHAHMKGWL